MGSKAWARAGIALLGMIPTAMAAQTIGAGQGVADKPRPDYDPIGARAGAFTLYPSLTVTGAATDNYLATDSDRRGDAYLYVQPEIDVRSLQSRMRLDARAFFNQTVHTISTENQSQYGASATSAYDVSHSTQLRFDGSVGRYVESRSSLGSFQGSAEPVHYESYHAGLGASHSFSELTLNANTAINYLNYHDTVYPDGTPIDQDYRDVRQLTVGGSANYDLRNGIGLIVSGQYTDEHYPFSPGSAGFNPLVNVDRNSSGFSLDGGITLELTHLIFGRLEVGYINQRYHDPRLANFGGLSFSADVLWNVTPLTSVRFRASRSVEDSSAFLIAGNTRSDFHTYVDHELYRYIILSGDLGYSHFRPNGIGFGGDEYTVGGGARYLINRRFSVTASTRYSGRSSDSTFLRYHAVIGSLSLRTAL